MPRVRDLGITIGSLPTGPTNSVLDIEGVGLGHATIWRDEPAPPAGRGVARTGVSCLVIADDAYHRPVPVGGAVLNGAGECTGFLTSREWRIAETPIYLTSTMQLGRVYDAACQIAIETNPETGDEVVIPIVGECDDSWLSESGRMQVELSDVRRAHDDALASRGSATPPEEGAVGSGTGMNCLGFKGGIGTASRVTPEGYTVAVLLMTNYGVRDELVIGGIPVGRLLPPAPPAETLPKPAGSCIGIAVTDAPVDGAACERLARRIGLGLARTGSVAHHGSGEIFMALGTGLRFDRDCTPEGPALGGRALDPLFAAVVEASEEAVLNSMFAAPDVVGKAGRVSPSVHNPEVLALLSGVRR